MAHSFVAYIDESGDEGWSFRDEPGLGSSEWFVISAVVMPTSIEIAELKRFHDVIRPIEEVRKAPIHFSKLNHEQRVAACAGIANTKTRFVSVCINKRAINGAGLKGKHRLYFYTTRYLLERISWLARDTVKNFPGDGVVKLVFSNRRQMSYDDLCDYVGRLRAAPDYEDVRIHWPAIDVARLEARPHNQLVGLRAVDTVASGIRYGLELSRYGFCEDRYGRLLAPRVYRHKERALPYGMKFFPAPPAVEPRRYAWISELFPK